MINKHFFSLIEKMCSPIKKKGVNDYATASCSAASNTVNQQTCSHYVSVDALKTDIVGYEMLCFTRSKKIHNIS